MKQQLKRMLIEPTTYLLHSIFPSPRGITSTVPYQKQPLCNCDTIVKGRFGVPVPSRETRKSEHGLSASSQRPPWSSRSTTFMSLRIHQYCEPCLRRASAYLDVLHDDLLNVHRCLVGVSVRAPDGLLDDLVHDIQLLQLVASDLQGFRRLKKRWEKLRSGRLV
jgi:hypothetical protein